MPICTSFGSTYVAELSSLSSNLDSTSCLRINRYGDNGSPCLRPLLGLSWFNLPPLTRTSKDKDEMHVSIHLMNSKSKPRLVSTAWRNLQLNRSYGFWRSSLIAMKPILTFLTLKLWSSSCRTTWFSAIHLPGIKADWQGEIILCKRGLSFETSSLEMILYTTL